MKTIIEPMQNLYFERYFFCDPEGAGGDTTYKKNDHQITTLSETFTKQ